ncbi:hypothetical protein PSPO01_13277, partial [Paraphaeosphaeria sporulosa]
GVRIEDPQGCPWKISRARWPRKAWAGRGTPCSCARTLPADPIITVLRLRKQPCLVDSGGGSRRHAGATAAAGHCWPRTVRCSVAPSSDSTCKHQGAGDDEPVRRSRKGADLTGPEAYRSQLDHVDPRRGPLKTMTAIRSNVAREAERLSSNTCERAARVPRPRTGALDCMQVQATEIPYTNSLPSDFTPSPGCAGPCTSPPGSLCHSAMIASFSWHHKHMPANPAAPVRRSPRCPHPGSMDGAHARPSPWRSM